jgi:hypothetical protein
MAARNPPCISCRVQEFRLRLELDFDGTAFAIDLQEFDAQRLHARRRRQPAIDDFPEERILVHHAALALLR